jgi:hypothetical protein
MRKTHGRAARAAKILVGALVLYLAPLLLAVVVPNALALLADALAHRWAP